MNPGPRAPEARIIPLDHWAKDIWLNWNCASKNWGIFGILKNFIYFQNGETTMIHFVYGSLSNHQGVETEWNTKKKEIFGKSMKIEKID